MSASHYPKTRTRSRSIIQRILLAILAIVLFGVGFVFKWLFIAAAIAALLFLISLFTGGLARRGI